MTLTPSREYILSMARYNTWMNDNLYSVCAELSDEARKADTGASYRSIHGTLNHLLLADRLLLNRLQGRVYPISSLAQELYSDFEELLRERGITNQDIERWADEVAGVSAEQLGETVWFQSATFDRPCGVPLWHLIVHFFNHQTHHRGQLTTLLSQAGCDFGIVDYLWLPGIEVTGFDAAAELLRMAQPDIGLAEV